MKNNNGNGGIGFIGALQLLFIALKLCNVINWSWWLVLSPFIIVATIIIVAVIVILIKGKKWKI